ncbi:hypothetical protein [Streptococcus hyovaginalis]|jgi:hypothetical protein|uniref:hypothetical protein n=1 Tax=Streptococcus hyovaginalis TaxID=149015 RepID=UPI002A80A773|nr:hypothetical protein [Streptococcus hyovaginalis]MDY4511123.1 hypothetical protein [Streptococcus hyovaginalis]
MRLCLKLRTRREQAKQFLVLLITSFNSNKPPSTPYPPYGPVPLTAIYKKKAA